MKSKGRLLLAGSLLFLYLASLFRVHLERTRLEAIRHRHPPGTSLVLKGKVVSLPLVREGRYRVEVGGPYLVELSGRGEAPEAGDLILVRGRVLSLKGFKNPWSMDREAWYTQRGVAFPLYVRSWDLLKARSLPFYRQLPLDFASWGVNRFKRDLGDSIGGVVASLVLGFRRGMEGETRWLFSSTGLGHLLAVSGFHMGVVFLFLYTIVRLILKAWAMFSPPVSMESLPSRRALVPALLLLFFYLMVTGSPPSAVRAFIMIACWVVARFWGRDRSLEGALVLAFLLMTLANPLVVLRVGFQLTFAAMVGVVVVLRMVEPLEGWKSGVVGYLAMALLIPLFTLPLLLLHFHRFSLYAPLANLLFILPAGALVTLGLLHLLLAPLSLQGWLVVLEKWSVGSFLKGLAFVSGLPGASLWVTRKEAWFLSALVVTGLLGLMLVKRGKEWALFSPLLAFSLLFLPSPRGAMVLDMGKRGRALLFQGERTVLVDAGSVRGWGAWSSLRDALLWREVRRVDALVVSRTIPSRASLVPRVLETFRVGRIYLPTGKSPLGSRIALLARERGVEVVEVGRVLCLPGLEAFRVKGGLKVRIPPLGLEMGRGGWFWRGRLLEPWRTGAVEVPWPREVKPFKSLSLCSKKPSRAHQKE